MIDFIGDIHGHADKLEQWWDEPSRKNYKSISVGKHNNLPDQIVDISLPVNADYYQENEKPVFFGHYWLEGHPVLFRDNICCIDYSVAQDEKLVAYRFDGEKKLVRNNLISVQIIVIIF